MTTPFNLIVRAIVLITTIPIHEYAHAYVADKLGDPTARYSGRLTLNPMAHFDPIGSIALIFTGIGWARPVPVNARNFDDPKKGMALSAAAGPIANLLLALGSYTIAKILMYLNYMVGGSVISTLFIIFQTMASINITLAVFNLIPIPPFDGSRILNYFLPNKMYFKLMEYERYVFPVLLLVVFFGLFDWPISIISSFVFFIADKLTFFIDIIFRAILF